MGIELFGAFGVVDKHLGDAAAFERDDALPRFCVFGLKGEDEDAVAAEKVGQAFVVVDFGGFVPARGGADGLVGSGFDDEHFQTTLSLNLDDERAVGFEVAGQERACGKEFAQGAADGGGIVFLSDDVFPYVFKADVQTAHGHIVEDETGADVGVVDLGLRHKFLCYIWMTD